MVKWTIQREDEKERKSSDLRECIVSLTVEKEPVSILTDHNTTKRIQLPS